VTRSRRRWDSDFWIGLPAEEEPRVAPQIPADPGPLPAFYLSDDTLVRMGRAVSATGQDATVLVPSRFAAGYVKSVDNRRQPRGNQDSRILSEEAFGRLG
jgi:hypothetical protein